MKAPGPERGFAFRPDLEGLRGLAVSLVVADHLFEWPVSGFVGVDVFFVISGYLITGLLLQEAGTRGRISFVAFYRRRAARILPGALLVLGTTVLLAHVVFRGARVHQAVGDAGWAAVFAANLHFADIGTDYFQARRSPSPVQHFWSLAVEEQFYLLWPVAIAAVLWLVGARLGGARRLRGVLTPVVVAVVIASFLYALRETRSTPAAAYFSTLGRAWEIAAGAAAAVLLSTGSRWAERLRRRRGPLWLAGTGGVVAAALVATPGTAFPAPGAVPAVASTVVVLLAGADGNPGRWTRLLSNPPMRYLGRLSYSLYLWHWPAVVFVEALLPHPSPGRPVLALLLALGVCVLSYHLVEDPCRRLLSSGSPRRRRFGAYRNQLAAGVCCLAAAGLLAVLAPLRGPAAYPAGPAGRLPDRGLAAGRAATTRAIQDALGATRFPRFAPGLSEQGTARAHWSGCDSADVLAELDSCVWGSAAREAPIAVVLGDSTAMSWLPGIEAALGDRWRVVGLTLEACPAADIPVLSAGRAAYPACDRHRAAAVKAVDTLDPDLVLLSSSENTLARLATGHTGDTAQADYHAAMRRTLGALRPTRERRVVTLSPPPLGNPLDTCDTATAVPMDCVRSVTDSWIAQADADAAAAQETGSEYLDTRLWFCSAAGYCPAFVGDTAVRWDDEHVTDVYIRRIAPDLRAALAAR